MLTEYTSTSLPILHLSLFQFLTCFLCLFFLSLSLFPPFPPFSYSCLSLQPPPLPYSPSPSLPLSLSVSNSLLLLFSPTPLLPAAWRRLMSESLTKGSAAQRGLMNKKSSRAPEPRQEHCSHTPTKNTT